MATKQPPDTHGKAPQTGKGQSTKSPSPGPGVMGPSKHIPTVAK